MKVLHAAAECAPLLKTGGLADVVGALPEAQRAAGLDARVLLPGFPDILCGMTEMEPIGRLPSLFGAESVQLWRGALPNGVPAFVIEAPGLYDRPGNPYADAQHHAYADNHRRFALLGWMAAEIADGFVPHWQPDILHGHDWHAGLAPAYLRARSSAARAVATVFSIHNLAYQGLFPAHCLNDLALPPTYFHMDGFEFHGAVSFIKAGLYYSDQLTTVSPSYAREIQTPDFGCGLDGLLTARRSALTGILNGVDATHWNPATDAALGAHYDAQRMAGKARCKHHLQHELGLSEAPRAPLFGVVSRLTAQKGLNLVLEGAAALIARGGQLVVLGSGDTDLEAGFAQLARHHPEQVAVQIGFDEALSRRIFAGADVVLVPSRFEPCGLTQLYALRYGALPLVRRTGGLADTVMDASLENLADGSATGFVFERFELADFLAAMRRAFVLYDTPARWRAVRQHAMAQRFDWALAAAHYQDCYTAALAAVSARA